MSEMRPSLAALFFGVAGFFLLPAQLVAQEPHEHEHGEHGHQHEAKKPTQPDKVYPLKKGEPAEKPALGRPKARCAEAEYQFGSVWAGTKIEHSFKILNDGEGPLHIQEVRPTCGCQVTKDYSRFIEAGGEGEITISLDTTKQRNDVHKRVVVRTNDPTQQTLTLAFRGKVTQHISLEPGAGATWPNIATDKELTKVLKLTNNMPDPIKLEVAPDQAKSAFQCELREVQAGQTYEVTVTATPPFIEGLNQGDIKLKTDLEDKPYYTIPCRLYQPPVIQVIPPMITLTTAVPREYTRRVELRYNGEGEMKVLETTCSADNVTIDLHEKQPGRQFQVWLTLPQGFSVAPAKPVELQIKTDHPKKPLITVPIVMRTRGPSLQLPERLVGRPAPRGTVRSTTENVAAGFEGGDGKVTLLNFWASWCPNSRQQIEIIQKVAEQFDAADVEVVMVSVDKLAPTERVLGQARELGIQTPVGLDTDRKLAGMYSVSSIPTLFVMARTGVIEAVHRGYRDQLREGLAAQVELLRDRKGRAQFPQNSSGIGRLSGLGVTTVPQKTTQAVMGLESAIQDTGEHLPGSPVLAHVYFRNDGQQQLQVTRVEGIDGLEVAAGYDEQLSPGEKGQFEVTFTAPERTGDFRKQLTIHSNDPYRSRQIVQLWGSVRPLIEVSPATGLDFSDPLAVEDNEQTCVLTYHGDGKVNYLSAISSSPNFAASLQPIPDSSNAVLVVKSVPPFENDRVAGVIVVRTDCPSYPVVEVQARYVRGATAGGR
jgi:thiol-disulfide isomerase/thioredoxin